MDKFQQEAWSIVRETFGNKIGEKTVFVVGNADLEVVEEIKDAVAEVVVLHENLGNIPNIIDYMFMTDGTAPDIMFIFGMMNDPRDGMATLQHLAIQKVHVVADFHIGDKKESDLQKIRACLMSDCNFFKAGAIVDGKKFGISRTAYWCSGRFYGS